MELFKLFGTIAIDSNDAEKKINDISNRAEKAGKSFSSMASDIGKGFSIFAGGALFNNISNGLKNVVGMGMEFNNSMEQNVTSFSVFLKDANKAKTLMSDLNTMAKNTPFELKDLSEGATRLLNYGVGLDTVKTNISDLGNIAMGNAEKLQGLSTAYGQVKGNGRLLGEELNQMIERGFNPLVNISARTGESMEDLRSRMGDGLVTFAEVEQAVKDAANGNGQFAGSMDKMSMTFQGQMSTLRDNASQTFGAVLQPLFTYLTDTILPKLNTKLSEMGDISAKLKPYIDEIKTAYNNLILVLTFVYNNFTQIATVMTIVLTTMKLYTIIGTITALYRSWMIASEGLTVVQWALNAAMTANPIGLVIVAIGALIAIGYLLWQNWDIIVQKFGFIGVFFVDIFNVVKNAVMTFVNMAVQKWNELLPVIMPIIQTIGAVLYTLVHIYFEMVKLYLIILFTVFSTIFKNIADKVMWAVEFIKPLLSALGYAFSWLADNVISPAINRIISGWNSLVSSAISIKNQLVSVFTVLAAPLIIAFQQIMNVADQLGGKIRTVFSGVRDSIVNALSGAASSGKSAMNSVIRVLNGLKFTVPAWVPVMGGKGFSMSIPYLAKGGDIQRGGRVIVGEQGAEMLDLPTGARVTPLNKANDKNVTVNINYPTLLNNEAIDDIMNIVVRRLRLEGAY